MIHPMRPQGAGIFSSVDSTAETMNRITKLIEIIKGASISKHQSERCKH
jgi:hypothetical protein